MGMGMVMVMGAKSLLYKFAQWNALETCWWTATF